MTCWLDMTALVKQPKRLEVPQLKKFDAYLGTMVLKQNVRSQRVFLNLLDTWLDYEDVIQQKQPLPWWILLWMLIRHDAVISNQT